MRKMSVQQLEERLRSLIRYAKLAGRHLPRVTLCCDRSDALKAGVTDQNGRLCFRVDSQDDWTEIVLTTPKRGTSDASAQSTRRPHPRRQRDVVA